MTRHCRFDRVKVPGLWRDSEHRMSVAVTITRPARRLRQLSGSISCTLSVVTGLMPASVMRMVMCEYYHEWATYTDSQRGSRPGLIARSYTHETDEARS